MCLFNIPAAFSIWEKISTYSNSRYIHHKSNTIQYYIIYIDTLIIVIGVVFTNLVRDVSTRPGDSVNMATGALVKERPVPH